MLIEFRYHDNDKDDNDESKGGDDHYRTRDHHHHYLHHHHLHYSITIRLFLSALFQIGYFPGDARASFFKETGGLLK